MHMRLSYMIHTRNPTRCSKRRYEITKAYKERALQLHPDKCKLPGGEDAFKKLHNAYISLVDDLTADPDNYSTDLWPTFATDALIRAAHLYRQGKLKRWKEVAGYIRCDIGIVYGWKQCRDRWYLSRVQERYQKMFPNHLNRKKGNARTMTRNGRYDIFTVPLFQNDLHGEHGTLMQCLAQLLRSILQNKRTGNAIDTLLTSAHEKFSGLYNGLNRCPLQSTYLENLCTKAEIRVAQYYENAVSCAHLCNSCLAPFQWFGDGTDSTKCTNCGALDARFRPEKKDRAGPKRGNIPYYPIEHLNPITAMMLLLNEPILLRRFIAWYPHIRNGLTSQQNLYQGKRSWFHSSKCRQIYNAVVEYHGEDLGGNALCAILLGHGECIISSFFKIKGNTCVNTDGVAVEKSGGDLTYEMIVGQLISCGPRHPGDTR